LQQQRQLCHASNLAATLDPSSLTAVIDSADGRDRAVERPEPAGGESLLGSLNGPTGPVGSDQQQRPGGPGADVAGAISARTNNFFAPSQATTAGQGSDGLGLAFQAEQANDIYLSTFGGALDLAAGPLWS
jgi:hypothetical protein